MGLVLTDVDNGYNGTFPIRTNTSLGDSFKAVFVDVAFDSSYPTGGEIIDLTKYISDNGLILAVIVPEDVSGYSIKYKSSTSRVPSTGKLMVYYSDYDAVADGVLVEVPNTTDLSALIAVRVMIMMAG